jgi:hypothetical protein
MVRQDPVFEVGFAYRLVASNNPHSGLSGKKNNE